jgi:hypothetical protein
MSLLLPLLLLVVAAAASMVAVRWLSHLPAAPECPRCRAVTGQRGTTGVVDRVCAALEATPVRRCPRCGWAGRMRWYMARERVPRDPRG